VQYYCSLISQRAGEGLKGTRRGTARTSSAGAEHGLAARFSPEYQPALFVTIPVILSILC